MGWNKTPLLCLATLVFVSWPSPSWPHGFTDRYDRAIQQSVKRWWPDVPSWRLWKAQLYQESRLDPAAVSPLGARGLAQFMPATWGEVSGELGIVASPHSELAIDAGAYYMAKLRRIWKADRTALERHELAQASYNAGAGNILKAQSFCGDARRWSGVRECLHLVTGARNADETKTYVTRIARWWREMEMQP